MTMTLRIVLVVVSILNCAWILLRIRKAQVKIEDSVFWILFSAMLILMSIFPGIITWGTEIVGVQSPVNFVFLAIIFVLLLKVFRLSIRVSQLESKLQTLVQRYAIDKAISAEWNDKSASLLNSHVDTLGENGAS